MDAYVVPLFAVIVGVQVALVLVELAVRLLADG
jgi:hypothetical protein